jgi:hypothetical protein
MMATVAVTAFIPTYSANAEGAAGDNGGICTPQSITLGTDTGHSTEDTGVATYVGGDMYVGKKTGGNMLDVNGPSVCCGSRRPNRGQRKAFDAPA